MKNKNLVQQIKESPILELGAGLAYERLGKPIKRMLEKCVKEYIEHFAESSKEYEEVCMPQILDPEVCETFLKEKGLIRRRVAETCRFKSELGSIETNEYYLTLNDAVYWNIYRRFHDETDEEAGNVREEGGVLCKKSIVEGDLVSCINNNNSYVLINRRHNPGTNMNIEARIINQGGK